LQVEDMAAIDGVEARGVDEMWCEQLVDRMYDRK
jgi:hypothetical protein